MKEFWKIYKKVNGSKQLLEYKRAGVLTYALSQFILLGPSKRALEILRIAVQYKIANKLKRKYSYVLKKYDNFNFNALPHKAPSVIWVCWLQGIENAPSIVKKCFDSLSANLTDRKIVVINKKNYHEYITIPDFIVEKWNKGIISNAHFSDIIRVFLLTQHGGTWIDATVYCTGKDIPDYILNSQLFLYQMLKPGKEGRSIQISSWLITSESNQKLLYLTRELLVAYWAKNNYTIDYYLFHLFFNMVCDQFPCEWNKVIKFPNSIPHILLLSLFEPYDELKYESVKKMTCFHKLSYKLDEKLVKKQDTFFDIIFN